MQVHSSITLERVQEAVEEAALSLDNPGFCIACGESTEGVEPDARRCPCESCGQPAVYGAEELALMLM
jgi:Zn finger protein HypA/HybF involved in hydrogenase expression